MSVLDTGDGFGTVTAFMAATATINSVSAISKKADPTPILFATGGLYVLLLVIGLFTRWEVVKPFAGIIFLLAVLSNAFPLINGLIGIVQSSQTKAAQSKKTTSQAKAPTTAGK